jgi:hypothetical protein
VKCGGLVGDCPACDSFGESGLIGGFVGDGFGHGGEGGLDFRGLGPDGDVLEFVVIGDVGLGESVGDGWRGEGVYSGDVAVAVAEARRVAVAAGGDGVTAGVGLRIYGDGKELSFDEGVELFGLRFVRGFDGEVRSVGEEALGVVEEAGVEGLDEVFRGGGGLGVAAENQRGEEDCGGWADEAWGGGESKGFGVRFVEYH